MAAVRLQLKNNVERNGPPALLATPTPRDARPHVLGPLPLTTSTCSPPSPGEAPAQACGGCRATACPRWGWSSRRRSAPQLPGTRPPSRGLAAAAPGVALACERHLTAGESKGPGLGSQTPASDQANVSSRLAPAAGEDGGRAPHLTCVCSRPATLIVGRAQRRGVQLGGRRWPRGRTPCLLAIREPGPPSGVPSGTWGQRAALGPSARHSGAFSLRGTHRAATGHARAGSARAAVGSPSATAGGRGPSSGRWRDHVAPPPVRPDRPSTVRAFPRLLHA